MRFFSQHSAAIQAIAGLLTVLLAAFALLGVKWQIDAADRIQKAQSARDIYREFLNISIANPDFSQPDYCALSKGPRLGAYESYVDYLMYTAEQLLAVDAEWSPVFKQALLPHKGAICDITDKSGYAQDVRVLIEQFQQQNCQAIETCP